MDVYRYQNSKITLNTKGVLETLMQVSQKSEELFGVPRVLFHGGEIMEEQVLGKGFSDEEYIYATDDPMYALFLASIKLADAGRASVEYEDNVIKLYINSAFTSGDSKFSLGRVYILDAEVFQKGENVHEFITDQDLVTPVGWVDVDLTQEDFDVRVSDNL